MDALLALLALAASLVLELNLLPLKLHHLRLHAIHLRRGLGELAIELPFGPTDQLHFLVEVRQRNMELLVVLY
jgi:hypothetical protein